MRGVVLLFTLHFGQEHPRGDRWFAPDKAKHFFAAAFAQTISFSAIRATGAGRGVSLAGATVVSAGLSVAKEIHDRRSGDRVSGKDLTWDVAGITAATALLERTKR